jgi:hypothetical protein
MSAPADYELGVYNHSINRGLLPNYEDYALGVYDPIINNSNWGPPPPYTPAWVPGPGPAAVVPGPGPIVPGPGPVVPGPGPAVIIPVPPVIVPGPAVIIPVPPVIVPGPGLFHNVPVRRRILGTAVAATLVGAFVGGTLAVLPRNDSHCYRRDNGSSFCTINWINERCISNQDGNMVCPSLCSPNDLGELVCPSFSQGPTTRNPGPH